MKVLRRRVDFKQVRKGCVLTIGNFDGVHVGHQEILRTARQLARQKAAEMVVIHLLRDFADDCIIVLEDSKELLDLSPEDFVDTFLMATIEPAIMVEGNDFNFGADRKGNLETLRQLGQVRGFDVVVVPPRQIQLATAQTLRVSSTLIRYMLESGHVAEAAAALSRPYRLLGPIIPGWGRGKKLGYPTLNMRKPDQIIPGEGVYAGSVEIADSQETLLGDNERIDAVFSIGQATTFGGEHPLLIEAHLLTDDVGDMTDKWMAMDFLQRLRDQHKFATPEDLVAQIGNDCRQAQAILQNAYKEG